MGKILWFFGFSSHRGWIDGPSPIKVLVMLWCCTKTPWTEIYASRSHVPPLENDISLGGEKIQKKIIQHRGLNPVCPGPKSQALPVILSTGHTIQVISGVLDRKMWVKPDHFYGRWFLSAGRIDGKNHWWYHDFEEYSALSLIVSIG